MTAPGLCDVDGPVHYRADMVTPTKATKRTPAKRAVKATAAAPPPADVGDEAEAKAPGDGPVTITWRGRKMAVKRPSAAMIGVWQLTAKELTNAAKNSNMSGAEAADAAGRAIQIIVSVLEDKADKAWVKDLLLDDEGTIEDAAGILTLTNEAYAEMGNREERRAPASKARRR